MYGLPIFRRETASPPVLCTDLFGCDGPPRLKSALRLAQMILNHYTLIISADYKQLAAWGSTAFYGKVGLTSNYNKPKTCTINWDAGIARSIIQIYTHGGAGFWSGNDFTIFITEDNQLYGTGDNSRWLLNKPTQQIYNEFNLIAKNVIEFCCSYYLYMLYIKANGKVYGLGPSSVGFGFPQNQQRDLTIDDGSDSNYLGVDNAVKVFTTSPDGGNSKSFVLRNDGTVLACGYNTDGCLGVNSTQAIVYEWTPVVTSNDGGATFQNLTGVVDVITSNWVLAGGANVGAQTWAGGSGSSFMSTYFLTKSGRVYTCGNNKFGQLGLGLPVTSTVRYAVDTGLEKVNNICTTAGGASVLATTTEDKVFSWGNNQWGQLGTEDTQNKSVPNLVDFPQKKIQVIHGGGMYGVINGAFVISCSDGTVYGAGFNETYALGITTNGVPNPGPITKFTKNEYFGPNPSGNQDPERYPLFLTGDLTASDIVIRNAQIFADKTVLGSIESVYVRSGMVVTGAGIAPDTRVRLVNEKTNEIYLDKPVTATINGTTIRYDSEVNVYQVDLCGYGTEMAQKVVTADGTLYMSGWNQEVNGYWNFNPFFGSQNVSVPTFFDAKHFL